MAKILSIEDNGEFCTYLSSVLREHSITYAADLQNAIDVLRNGVEHFDLILLDIGLPDGNGLKAIPNLKEISVSKSIPIIVLSADGDVVTKVAAFGIGADDYLAKPPNSSELKARIEARIRSNEAHVHNRSKMTYGNLSLDLGSMTASVKLEDNSYQVLDLTGSEFKILKLTVSRPGQVYSREQIIDHIWGGDRHVTPRTIDAHISNLRKKMPNSNVSVETVVGLGYKAILKGNALN